MYRKLFLVRLACLLSLFCITHIVHAQVCVDLVGDGDKPIQAVNTESLHVANDYDTIVNADTRVGVVYLSLIGGSQPIPNACGLTPKNPPAEWTGWGGPLDTDNATVGEGPWSRSNIVIGGIYFERGLGSHAVGTLVYDLSGETYTRFEGWIGMSDEKDLGACGHGGSGTFVFLLDGREVFHSPTLLGVEGGRNVPPVKVTLAIPATARELTIVMGDGGDGIACDHSVIGDAKLLTARVTGVGPEPVRVSTVEPVVDPPIREPVQPPVVDPPIQEPVQPPVVETHVQEPARPPVVEIPVQQQADRPIVRLIYFRPSDRPVRPGVDAAIDRLIKRAQRFFADEMERHGFGRKTFQFETDAHGNAVVHHVNGKFPNAHYQQNSGSWVGEIREQIYIPRRSFTVHMLDSDPDGRSFTGFGGTGGGTAYGGGSADIDAWSWSVIAHELGHAFGAGHDFRDSRYIMSYGSPTELSPCFAAWLDVHPAFNPTVVRIGTRAKIQMLPATLAAPPNAIRLRFTVTAPAGSLYQARLLAPEKNTLDGYAFNSGGLIGCKRIDGNPTSNTVEFVTALTPDTKSVSLQIISIDGNSVGESFPIDVASLLPPAKVVSIPDPNLAAAVRESLNMSAGETFTTHSILSLVKLDARNRGIKSLTGLEHAVNLTEVGLGWEYISGEGYVNSNAISDVSPLEKLTNLQELDLDKMSGLRDVSALASLTNLEGLSLGNTAVSDVSALANLTNLEWLYLGGTDVSDVSALASLTNLEGLNLRFTDVSDVSALANLTNLERLSLAFTGVDVSALANLTNLTWLVLGGTAVSDVSALTGLTNLERLELSSTGVSDVSALANLTNLEVLFLNDSAVSDVSALASLTNLERLELKYSAVSDVSALANLTNLERLLLYGCPLSYASIHTHIPALQAKGIGVNFESVAHPALLKVSGNGQEGAGATALPNPFVVEAMDERGEPMVGRTVQFDILGGGGSLSAKTVETDARGKARVTLTLGSSQGVNKVKASSEGIQSWVLFMAVATEAAPQLVADVNGDGVTNLADLAIVAQAMGKPVENPRADVNGDGVVDAEDFALVAAHLGEGEAAAPSQAVLPAGLTLEKVEWALNFLYAENTGSPAFQRGIAKLEGFLALLVPDETLLLANYPNPFNPETWIPYQLSEPAEVTVTIYAANGAVVRTLDLGHRRAGSYDSRSRAAYWDGRNAAGEPVASGVYFYTLSAGDFSATRKMVIRK